jgi:hypothetical protein
VHRCSLPQVVLSILVEVAGVEPASSEWHIGLIPIRYQSHPRVLFQISEFGLAFAPFSALGVKSKI